jgi:uncharacterized metal-binding protein YceD (DUF177 family)
MPFVHVDDVPAQGRRFLADHTETWATEAAALALDGPPDTLRLDLTVRLVEDPTRPRARDTLHVSGTVEARFPASCSRCLRPVQVHLQGSADLLYTRPPTTLAEELALEESDLEVGWLEKGRLDMAVPISEQLALLGQSRYRCTDPGVSRAGPDASPCSLPAQAPTPELRRANPFAALAKLKLPE